MIINKSAVEGEERDGEKLKTKTCVDTCINT